MVLGGAKNMLKTWLLNRRRRRLMKKQEREQNKRKKREESEKKKREETTLQRQYSKLEIVGKISLGLLAGALEVALTAPVKEKTVVIKKEEIVPEQLLEELNKVEIALAETPVEHTSKTIAVIEKKVKSLEPVSKIEPTTIAQIKEKLQSVKKRAETLEKNEPQKETKAPIFPVPIVSSREEEKERPSAVPVTGISVPAKEVSKEEQAYPLISKEIETETMPSPEEPVLKEEPIEAKAPILASALDLHFLKTANKKGKEYQRKLKELEGEIARVEEYRDFYDLEYQIKTIMEELKRLEEEYRNNPDRDHWKNLATEEIDPFKLAQNTDSLESLERVASNLLHTIDERKRDIFYRKEEKKEEEAPAKKETKKKVDTSEYKIANHLLLSRIEKERRELENIFRELSQQNPTNRKRGILSHLNRFAHTLLSFTLDLLPLRLFHNRLLGGLTSAIMINHTIRSMHRLIRPDIQVYYHAIDEALQDKQAILREADYVCQDSILEINKLRQSIILRYGEQLEDPEVQKLIQNLDQIEGQIFKQKRDMEFLDQKIAKEAKHQKQKLLRKE